MTAGEVLTAAQLTGLLFTPTAGAFSRSSALSYTVTDPANNSATGTATLAIGAATGAPVVSSPTLTVAEDAAATPIGIAAPTDPNYATSQLTITIGALPTDGTVTLANGVTAITAGEVLTAAQLAGLLFTPTAGAFSQSSALSYTVTDPTNNSATGTATLAIGAAIGAPMVSSPTLTVAEDAAATPIGIAAPTDPNYATSQLTITIGALPTDGTVTLADGVTAITAGEVLTAAQLTGLLFTPTAGGFSQSSALSYSVTDPANNSATGTATLAIAAAPTLNAPTFTTGSVITDNPDLEITGTAPPGSFVQLLSDGAPIDGGVADATTGAFAIADDLFYIGPNTLTATVTSGGDTVTSAPVTVYNLPAPVSGVSTADLSSANVNNWLTGGATFSFIGGTEAVQLTNGILSVGPDTNEASIERLYEGLLGRSGESEGLTYYDQQITGGASSTTAATDILNSPEYAADHGVQTDEQLVATLYQGLLGRPAAADPNSSFWLTQLAQGATPGAVAIGIANSPEAKTYLAADTAQVFVANPAGTLATELYQTALDRIVDLPSLANFQASYSALTPLQLAAQIVASPEFTLITPVRAIPPS